MNIQTKIRSSILTALGTVFVTAQSASAQIPATGHILGIEYLDGDRCDITLITEGDEILTQTASAITCDPLLVGNKIEYSSLITRVNVIEPPEIATVTEVTVGDRACYVTLQDDSNLTTSHFAEFSLCDSTLVGQRVQLTYGTASLNAFSCGGDLACGKTEDAEIISTAEVIGSTTAQSPMSPEDEQPESEQPEDEPPESEQPAPPAEAKPTVGSLPDGNYRYWNGPPTDGIVSDDTLLANGERTLVVTFRKQGNGFTGIFGYISDNTICVQGQINEDTVTGISIESSPGARPISTGETFESFNASDRLKLRRGRQIGTETINADSTPLTLNVIRYSSTLLDLEGLNRINAGTRVPPQKC